MDARAQKTRPAPAVRVEAARGSHRDSVWRGSVSGPALGCDALILFLSLEEVGEGPAWHVHPYDEIFVITEGRARFTVGDETFDAEAGDVVTGPAAVAHKYHNLGPGRLRSIDIHLSREWVQTDLEDPEKPAGGSPGRGS